MRTFIILATLLLLGNCCDIVRNEKPLID